MKHPSAPGAPWLRAFAAAALCVCAGGYWHARRGALAEAKEPARALGIASPRLPDDPFAQARAALQRDALARSERFANAALPGHTLAVSRPSEEAIDRGQYSPETLFEIGAQLFSHRFTRAEGFGGRDLPPLGRVQRGERGGPDAYACAECHKRGGPAGAGDRVDNAFLDGDGDRPDSALERNPPALTGLGAMELCAREMTTVLRRQEEALVHSARKTGKPARVELTAKGVSFGFLSADAEGTVSARGLFGVDPDLVVRPFGWKGHEAFLRDFVEDELLVHHGMESDALCAAGDAKRVGPFGGSDPDGDGVKSEIGEGQLTALTLFIAMQEIPREALPSEADQVELYAKGEQQFADLGCAACHVPSLPLDSTVYELPSRSGGGAVRVDLAKDGADPRLEREADGYRLHLYSDLKRHAMGPLSERRSYRRVAGPMFLTPPLWGVARSRPYLHDGSAPTLEDAILAHGGEASRARAAFAALREPGRAALRVFLTSLTRARRISAP